MLNKINISPEKQKLIIYIVLLLATLAVFWQVNRYDFINFDDQVYVTENSHIQSGITLDGFRWALHTTCGGLWHPLTWLSLMSDYQLYGLNASRYHLTNLILHILSVLLLFWLFNRMTGDIWRSAFVAALFALHPLRVESAVWIAERKDVLSVFFWMLTLCLYVYYTEKPVIKRYLPVVFFFACGLMSKSMVVTLPMVLILLDYWPLGRWQKVISAPAGNRSHLAGRLLGEKAPFILLTIASSIVSFLAQNIQGSFSSAENLPFFTRGTNAIISYAAYLEKTFWPVNLAVFYPYEFQLPLWKVLISGFIIIAITVVVVYYIKKLPFSFVGWLWYLGTLVPVIGLVQVGRQAMADRYTYLPSIGIAVILAWGVPLLFKREDIRKKILFPAAIVFLAIMSVLTWKQCGYWKNSTELWNHALHVTKDNAIAHNNLGLALFAEGKIEQAMVHYNEAIRLKPDNVLAYNNRGTAYNKLGQHQRALEDYTKAIFLQPDYFLAYYNRGNIYNILGQYQRAIEDFNKGLSLEPHYIVYNYRGIAYAQLGQYQRAIEDFDEAIRLKPDYANTYTNKALVYFNQKNIFSGCSNARKACSLGNCKILEDAKGKELCR
jgi:tetratricopeptide (TPR) repeat protein